PGWPRPRRTSSGCSSTNSCVGGRAARAVKFCWTARPTAPRPLTPRPGTPLPPTSPARTPAATRPGAVLGLRYYEDLPDADIAEVLGCGESTVRSQAARGLAALRAVLPEMQ